jgi:hypothetical protein
MYRGSSFLPQYTYTAHLGVIEQLVSAELSALWERDFGGAENDIELVPTILEAVTRIRDAYRPFASPVESRQASDTLVTKILLGTLGCMPACDRYFVDGFKRVGLPYSYLNRAFVYRVLKFCREHLGEFRGEQEKIEREGIIRYPLMKLVDMCFWQIGFELDGETVAPN